MRSVLRRRPSAETEDRRRFIKEYPFPHELVERINDQFEPQLDEKQMRTVLDGLRAWFIACLYGGKRRLGMPSKAVDVAWHEFILMTRQYHEFCEQAFGHYLHHSPEATMRTGSMGKALKQTVKVIDRHEAGGAMAATIPFLFAIDSRIGLDEDTGYLWTASDLGVLRATSGGVAGDPGSLYGVGFGTGEGGCGGGCGD